MIIRKRKTAISALSRRMFFVNLAIVLWDASWAFNYIYHKHWWWFAVFMVVMGAIQSALTVRTFKDGWVTLRKLPPNAATEPIMSYRAWRVYMGHLFPVTRMSADWMPGARATAVCGHEGPVFECDCGFYTFKTPAAVANLPGKYFEQYIFGRVAIWGRVVEHELGYRAQYAYPQVLYVPPNATDSDRSRIHEIAERYQIDIAPMPDDLVNALDD